MDASQDLLLRDDKDGICRLTLNRPQARNALSLAIGKKAFYTQADMDLAAAYAYTSEVMVRNLASLDAAEGIDAFLGKRDPVWRGC